MDAPDTLPEAATHYVKLDTGVRLHTRQWQGEKRPFLLVHGLGSNCLTWEAVAQRLAAAGHAVVTVDQRGHGLSEKPASGYDFATVAGDLAALIRHLGLDRPIVAGQSWGGNVVLAFGVHHPGLAHGLCFVDGGFLDLQSRSLNGAAPTWEATRQRLTPPPLDGTSLEDLRARIRADNPEWSEWGIEATLHNLEHLPDGTVRRRLPHGPHQIIIRALWDQRPPELYAKVQEPVLVCPAEDGVSAWLGAKIHQVAAAESGLPRVEVHWFHHTAHDIHVHRPDALARLMLNSLAYGIWAF